jgi:hypothetical protein
MSNSEESQPIGATVSPLPTPTATVVSNHEGEGGMGSRSMTVGRYEEIRRRLAEGRGCHQAAQENIDSDHAFMADDADLDRGAVFHSVDHGHHGRCRKVNVVDALIGLINALPELEIYSLGHRTQVFVFRVE